MILAGINYIEQQMTRCQLYLNRSVIRLRVPRLSSHTVQADIPMCKESRVVLRNLENTTKIGSYSSQKLQYIIDADKY